MLPEPSAGIHDTAPASVWEDAFLSGNGRHGAMVYGAPYDETVVVTHHALVRPNGTAGMRPPFLADRLDEVRDLLLAGKSFDAVSLFGGDWPGQAPQLFHPAFAIRLRLADRAPALRYRRAIDFGTGLVDASWHDGAGSWRRTCFVSRARDVVVQRLEALSGGELDLVADHDAALPGAPSALGVSSQVQAGGEECLVGLRVAYPDPATGLASGPGGARGAGGYVGATRIVAAGPSASVSCVPGGHAVRIHGARKVLLLTRVARYGTGQDPGALLDAALRGLAELPADYDTLFDEHARLHRAAFGHVRLDLGARPADRALPVSDLLARQAAGPAAPLPALLEKLFDSGRYLLLSASGLLPPRLPGLWQGDWNAAWSGAITTNANLNLQLAGAVAGDVPAAVLALADLIRTQVADWRVNARRLYGIRGILAPAHTDGTCGFTFHFNAAYPHHMWTAGADWLLLPLLDYVDATGDDEFLRATVLPVLTELALFYEDFLIRIDDEGQVIFVPSYSPENRPAGWSEAAVNATMDIAAARHALTAAADACTRLGIEGGPGEGVERWRGLLTRLPPYLINGEAALAEWAWPPTGSGRPPLADSYDHRHISHLYPVWPLREITPDGTPRLAAAALRALRLRGAQDDSAHGHLHRALTAARLREAALAGEQLAAITGGGFFFRSLMSSHYPHRSVYNADAACALPAILMEMLIGSAAPRAEPQAAGRVELLPAVPAFMPAGQLRGVRTLAQVTVELSWDLAAGRVAAVLRSAAEQRIDVVCAGAVSCHADVVVARLRPGAWRVTLPAGGAVRIDLEVRK